MQSEAESEDEGSDYEEVRDKIVWCLTCSNGRPTAGDCGRGAQRRPESKRGA